MTALAGSTSNSLDSTARHGKALYVGKSEARRTARRLRRAVPPHARAAMDLAICRNIEHLGVYRRARTVAFYLDFDGEPSITRLPSRGCGPNKSFFAPVLGRSGMRFHAVSRHEDLRRNWFGIREPQVGDDIDTRSLDLVLTPLVAFDRAGTRLGMGGGYYDRHFAFLRNRTHWHRPKLVGVAYSVQEVALLRRDAWDVPLWAIVTERGCIHCHEALQ